MLPDLELGTVFEEDNRDEEERGEEGRWVQLILVMDMINTPGRDIFFPLYGRISKIDVNLSLSGLDHLCKKTGNKLYANESSRIKVTYFVSLVYLFVLDFRSRGMCCYLRKFHSVPRM